jgi:antibiotic biosynthesis monooxygenase (ABM) superfamily enzyme
MWAQIIKTRMKPGVERDMAEIRDEMMDRVGQRPGLIRSLWMQNQNDPQEYYTVIVFETEEQARAGERELEQDPLFQRIRSLGEGTPEYIDLNVIESLP